MRFHLKVCTVLIVCVSIFSHYSLAFSYTGCSDPEYISYVKRRLAFYEKIDKEEYEEVDHNDLNLLEKLNPVDKYFYLFRFTILSARFDASEIALRNITAYDTLAKKLMLYKGDASHQINIAKGWLELTNNNEEGAIHYLMKSTQTEGSPVLGSFGPDMTLIRELYKRGRKKAVLEYLDKIQTFWENEEYINTWKLMIKNNCPIQFQFYDTTSLPKLNIK